MTTKKKTAEPQAGTPSPLLDAAGNPSPVAAGQIIESSWGNSVATRVVVRYTTFAEMNAVAAGDGTLAVELDNGVVWLRSGSVWKPTTIGNRIAFNILGSGVGQTINPGQPTLALFNNEAYDLSGVFDAGWFTCPPNWAGRWRFDWSVQFPDGGMTGARLVWCDIAAGRHGEQSAPAQEGGTRMAGSASARLNVGDKVGISMYHADSIPLLCNTAIHNHFQGYYDGPA